MSDQPDLTETLLARFRDGDPEAFRRLVAPHLPALRARAERWLDGRLRKKTSLRDVVQDAQLVAFERRATFEDRGAGSLRAWLLGIVDNCARDAIEHFGAQKRTPLRELTGEHRPASSALCAAGASPSQQALGSERQRLLWEARARLEHADRELLRLIHDEHVPLREVAARLGRSYAAIKKHHGRALLRLAEQLRHLRTGHD